MSYTVKTTKRFDKSFKKAMKRGCDKEAFQTVLSLLIKDGQLPPQYRPHKLSSKFNYSWECHINADWLLLWQQNDQELTLLLIDTCTHSDLFKSLQNIFIFITFAKTTYFYETKFETYHIGLDCLDSSGYDSKCGCVY